MFNNIFLGNLYLFFSFLMFFFGGGVVLFIRLELYFLGLNIMTPDFFNSLITVHGLIMIFGVIMPAFFGLVYWVLPYLFFLRRMFLNKIGILSFFFYFLSLFLLVFNFFLPLNFPSTGWTLYTPLSIQAGYNLDFLIISIIFLCISSLINAINISFTILKNYKTNLSIFIWSWLINSYLIISVMPILLGLMIMLFLDRHFFTSFFNPSLGGDVIMYQHIFWFFGHPEVYIMILPAFGIVSQVISVFSKNKIFGYKGMMYAISSISILSLFVWGHHMFITGISIIGQFFFMYCTMLISIPTGIKVFNWFVTIWNGFILFEIPILYSLGFIFFFTVGGFSGFILSIAPLNIYYHGTYFVVAHFHYILVSSTIFSIFSNWYYWSPIFLNVKFNNFKAKIHFWTSFIFLNLTFFPMHFLGIRGMPRRYIDYPIKYSIYNKFITLNSFFLGFSQLYFLYYILLPILIFI